MTYIIILYFYLSKKIKKMNNNLSKELADNSVMTICNEYMINEYIKLQIKNCKTPEELQKKRDELNAAFFKNGRINLKGNFENEKEKEMIIEL